MSVRTVTRRRGGTATIIDSPARAKSLAEHLLDPARTRPVVVVTTATGQPGPFIDVGAIVDAVRERADVYVLPTGNITFAMSYLLPERTQVYGGAGRVYPVDRTWQRDPYAAPLRFAFGPAQGPAATDSLIADALGAVNAVDLRLQRVDPPPEHVEGEVKALIAPSRAWVQIDDGRHAAIWQDLLRPGLPLGRTFRVGMRVSGVLDVEEGQIDVSASMRSPGDALVDYVVGTVVLGRVVEVDSIAAVVELYPGMRTGISAREVTGNPDDRLTALMSVDEVLPVRVTSRGGHHGRGWRLSTVDVEGSDEVMAAPNLLPDGPPWIVRAEVAAVTTLPRTSTAPLDIERIERTGVPVESPVDVQPLCPDVLLSLAPDGQAGPKPVPAKVDEKELLRRQITELDGLLLHARTLEDAFQFERDGFREQASESYARVQQLDRSVEKARTDLRLEKQKSQRLEKQVRSAKAAYQGSNAVVLFPDPVSQFRYEVDVAYAHRIPAGDKAARPRHEVRVGPDFLATLSSVAGVDRSKVVAVTVEIITDLVNELGGRDLHPLREGDGGGERDVVRPDDGARCMRVALQRKSPSARRLHYWKVGDAIELSRVVTHDDMTP
jgi:hypothetical protein